MKIAYLGPLANVHTARWVSAFGRMGHDVMVLSNSPLGTPAPPGLAVREIASHRTGSKVVDALLTALTLRSRAREIRKHLDEFGADVLHVHYLNEAAVLGAMAGGPPLVLTAWGSDIVVSPRRSPLRRSALRYAFRKAALVTCDAPHMRDRLVELGCAPEKVEIVFFGTDVQRFSPDKASKELRERLNPRGGPIVVSIRNFEPIYDNATILEAAAKVLQVRPDATFVMGGTGSQAAELSTLARTLKIDDRVVFPGRLNQDELPVYLASADAYVSVALSDGGLAASTAEAMAAGAPVVVTDIGNNRDWVTDGIHGRVVPVRDPAAVADALLGLLQEPASARRMGREGREVISARNSLQGEMARMEKLYRRVGETP